MVGCGDGGGAGADVTAAGKASQPAQPAPVNAETGKSNGMADASATPAPAGVKTGTPGG